MCLSLSFWNWQPYLAAGKPQGLGALEDQVSGALEGLQEEAKAFVGFIADQGADQCGFCNPGFVMNTIALLRENPDPTDDEIRAFLAGNLCRCSGYEGQLRGIRNFLNSRKN